MNYGKLVKIGRLNVVTMLTVDFPGCIGMTLQYMTAMTPKAYPFLLAPLGCLNGQWTGGICLAVGRRTYATMASG